METKKLSLPDGRTVDVESVKITNHDDPPTFIDLEDGSRIRLRIDVLEVSRIHGMWDAEGNPAYHVRSANTMAVLDAPDHLRGKPTGFLPAGNGS